MGGVQGGVLIPFYRVCVPVSTYLHTFMFEFEYMESEGYPHSRAGLQKEQNRAAGHKWR